MDTSIVAVAQRTERSAVEPRRTLAPRTALLRRRRLRGVTLVEVLIVVAIMAVIAGSAVFLVIPQLGKAKVKTTHGSAQTIRQAADVHMNVDGGECPTIADLVAAKKLDRNKTDDPFGTPFKITCAEGEIRVVSAGKDKKEGTPDDIRDDMKLSELEKIADL